MDYLLDANIVLSYLRQSKLTDKIDNQYAPLSEENTPIISVVSIGEIKSIAIQNNWGKKRTDLLALFLTQFLIADINVESIIDKYAEIDAFSQDKLPENPLWITARNMGKNDLWIAATASILGAKLLTTDNDFEHLNGKYLEIEIVQF